MLPVDSAALRKARGAFFTPLPVAEFIVEWAAVDKAAGAILEPSCGEAVFLHAAGQRGHKGKLVGVELHKDSAAESQRTLNNAGIAAIIDSGDFFTKMPTGSYDAVVGNPPYVRYQGFSGDARTRAQAAALRGGVSLTGLASSWAAFTVHSALFLKDGGRLGLVLPAELLSVNYAADVRRFLMERFSSVTLVLFEERVFPGVQEEVVLLLAEGYDSTGTAGTDHCLVHQVTNAAALSDFSPSNRWTPPTPQAKWTAAMLTAGALSAYASVTSSVHFTVLEEWGDTTLGMVTGNNKFFALSPQRVKDLKLTDEDVIPLSPPGSRHLRRLGLTAAALEALGEAGQPTYLFRPADAPSAAAKRYIAQGEATGVDLAYKCRVRTPWWRVPHVRPADMFLTYMNADTPRLTANRVRAHHLNSVHGVYLRDGLRQWGKDLLPLASLNSVTLLGAETVGRAYGGGMLKIEPKEADVLPLPSPELVWSVEAELRSARGRIATLLDAGDLLGAVAVVDEILLRQGMGLPASDLKMVRDAHAELTARRMARGKER